MVNENKKTSRQVDEFRKQRTVYDRLDGAFFPVFRHYRSIGKQLKADAERMEIFHEGVDNLYEHRPQKMCTQSCTEHCIASYAKRLELIKMADNAHKKDQQKKGKNSM